MLYKLIKTLFNEKLALITVFIFNFSPISIYLGRSAHFDMPIIFFNLATIFYFYRWVTTERLSFAILANLSYIFAVSLKVINLYLLLPLFIMAFSKWKLRLFLKNWFSIFSFAIILAWQYWDRYLRLIAPHKNWLHFDLAYNLGSIRLCLTSLDFYKKVYSDALNYVLTPLGLTFFIIGFLLKKINDSERMIYYWLLSVLLFYFIMPEGLWAHGYYHIHYLPIAAFFAAKSFSLIINKYRSEFKFANSKVIVVIFAFLFLFLSSRYFIPFYMVAKNKKFVINTAEVVKEKISSDKLIISCVDGAPSLLYYSDRKGWAVDLSDKGIEGISILEELKKKGANYFVCAFKKELEENKEFMRYLTNRYPIIFEDTNTLIVDLGKQK